MKKIIKLTENDLAQIVRKIIKEQIEDVEVGTSEIKGDMAIIRNSNKEEVENFIGKLPDDAVFLTIIDCEFADFSGFDVCLTNLEMINLKGTPNNLDKQNFECVHHVAEDVFELNKKN